MCKRIGRVQSIGEILLIFRYGFYSGFVKHYEKRSEKPQNCHSECTDLQFQLGFCNGFESAGSRIIKTADFWKDWPVPKGQSNRQNPAGGLESTCARHHRKAKHRCGLKTPPSRKVGRGRGDPDWHCLLQRWATWGQRDWIDCKYAEQLRWEACFRAALAADNSS